MSRPPTSGLVGLLLTVAAVAGGCNILLGIDSPTAAIDGDADGGTEPEADADPTAIDAPIGPAIDAPIGPVVDAGPPADAVTGNPVTELAIGQITPRGIAVDLNNVYWTNMNGTVNRVLKNGTSPTMLAAGPSAAEGQIYISSGFAYWMTREPKSPFRLYRTAIGGGGAFVNILANFDAPSAYAVDATGITYVNALTVRRANHDGTNQTTIGAAVPNPPYWLTKSGDRIYWVVYGNVDGKVVTMNLTNAQVNNVATDLTQPEQVVTDGTRVYWTNVGMNDPVGGGILANTGSVMSALPDGSDLVIITSGVSRPRALTVDADFLYWYSVNLQAVVRAPKGGGGPIEVVAVPSGELNAITSDSTSLYWVTGSKVEKTLKVP